MAKTPLLLLCDLPSGFGFRISASGFGLEIWGSWFGVSVSGFGFRGSGLGFRVAHPNFGKFQISGEVFGVWG